MFAAIDKLFALHNAMLLESRLIKAFLVYSMLILVIYMLTSTKQTYAARCKLYLGMYFYPVYIAVFQLGHISVELTLRMVHYKPKQNRCYTADQARQWFSLGGDN